MEPSFVPPSASGQPYGSAAPVPPAPELPTDENELWRQWHASAQPDVRECLVERYMPYARAVAATTYKRRVHNEFAFDEYFHFAVIGMLEALDRFEPGRGASFKSFATPRMQGSILNGLDRLSERQQQIGLRRRLARERLESLRPGESDGDPAHQLLQQLGDLGIGIALGFLLEGTGMLVDHEERLPDNAYSQVELRQLQERVCLLVDRLTEREAQVVRRHYLQQQSFEEIATTLQLSKGRISQLHRQALERLRKLLEGGEVEVAW